MAETWCGDDGGPKIWYPVTPRMGPIEAWRAAKQWGPFALRTAAYGTVSCTLGPLTRDHRASLWAMRTWCKESAKALDIEVVVDGLENAPEGPFVY